MPPLTGVKTVYSGMIQKLKYHRLNFACIEDNAYAANYYHVIFAAFEHRRCFQKLLFSLQIPVNARGAEFAEFSILYLPYQAMKHFLQCACV